MLPLECTLLIEWWEAGGSVDLEQLVLPLECCLIEWWEAVGSADIK